MTDGHRTQAPRRVHLTVLLGFLAVAVALFAPADLAATTRLIGATTSDNSQHAWFLAWLPHAIAAHVNPLYSGDVVAPTGVNLAWNTWLPLPALLLTPVTLTAGPVAAFNSAVTLGAALSAFSMYLAATRFLRGRGAAIAAGAAYGFAPFVLVHAYTGHSNLAIALVPPLLLLSLDSIVVRQQTSARRAGLTLGLLVVVQFFITEELLASEAVAVVVGIAWLTLLHRDLVASRWRHATCALGWASLVAVPTMAYPVWFQFFGPNVPTGVVGDNTFFVTDLLNVVLPTYSQGVDPGFAQAVAQHYAGNSGEWAGYVGLPLLAVVAWTAWTQWSRPLVRAGTLTAATLLLVSFGSSLRVAGFDTHIPMPGVLLAHLPVLDNLLPARFAVYVALFSALLLGVFVDTVPRSSRGRRVLLMASVLVVAAYLPPLPFPTRAAPTPAFFTVSPRPYPLGSTLLVLPFAHDFYSADAMRWQAEAQVSFRMPEGYIITRSAAGTSAQGPPPSTTSTVFAALAAGTLDAAAVTSGQRAAITAELRAWDVAAVVVVDGTPNTAAMNDLLAAMDTGVGRAVHELGVTYWILDAGPALAHR